MELKERLFDCWKTAWGARAVVQKCSRRHGVDEVKKMNTAKMHVRLEDNRRKVTSGSASQYNDHFF